MAVFIKQIAIHSNTKELIIGVRAGGARGAAAPPQSLGNSVFLGSKRNLGKASF